MATWVSAVVMSMPEAPSPRVIAHAADWGEAVIPGNPHGIAWSAKANTLRQVIVSMRASEGPILVITHPQSSLSGSNVQQIDDLDLRSALTASSAMSTTLRRFCSTVAGTDEKLVSEAWDRLSGMAIAPGLYRRATWQLGSVTPTQLDQLIRTRELPPPQAIDGGGRFLMWCRRIEDVRALLTAGLTCDDSMAQHADAAWQAGTEINLSSDHTRLANALIMADPVRGAVVAQHIRQALEGSQGWLPWADACRVIMSSAAHPRLPVLIDTAFQHAANRPATRLRQTCTFVIDVETLADPTVRESMYAILRLGRKSNTSAIIIGTNPESMSLFREQVAWQIADGPMGPQLTIGRDTPQSMVDLLVAERIIAGERLLTVGSL